jgi:hypothetical protein
MRLAAFLLALAVAVGAFLVLRSPADDPSGLSPETGATSSAPENRVPVDLVRGEPAPAARSQVAPAAAPAAAAKPVAKEGVKQPETAPMPAAVEGIGAVSAEHTPESDPEMDKKYSGSSPDERRQAIDAIRDLVANSTNLDPKLAAALKQEIEWLERSLDG